MPSAGRSTSDSSGRTARSRYARWRLQLVDLHPLQEPLDFPGVQCAGAEVLGRLGAAGDAIRQALARRGALVAGRDVTGQEHVARAHRRDRLELLDLDLV